MFQKLSVLILLTASVTTFSVNAEEFHPNFYPQLEIVKVSGEVSIDGKLDEDIWKKAAVADNFAEVNPGNQTKPAVKSKALVAYDENNLYIALIAYDDPKTVRASYCDRDAIFRDDYFGIMLDTYGDNSWGYELFVNPYGIQGDLRMESSGNEDMSFDIIWDSRGIITENGYQVEIAIPFSSLRFPNRDEQTWRINFWRDHQRDIRRKYAWAAQDRDNACFICQWGYLTGIKGIKPATNLEILPNLVVFQSGEREIRDYPKSAYVYDNLDAEAAFNVRYGISSTSSLEFTYNPDFSQVESDAAQVDVNTNFALFYDESRPFFQEGRELFSSPFDAVYTRSINDPKAAGKFTGKFGKTSLAYLFGYDENSPVTIPLQQQSIFTLAGNSFNNIFRIKQQLKSDSYIGFMFTDKRLSDFGENDIYSGGSGTIAGIDGLYRFKSSYSVRYQVLFSHTEEINDKGNDLIDTTYSNGYAQSTFDHGKHTVALDGEKFSGHAARISFNRSSNHWNYSLAYIEKSPTFRASNGFINQNDNRTLDLWSGYTFRPNKKWLVVWEPSLDIGRSWTHSGHFNPIKYNNAAYDEWIRGELYMYLRWQTDFSISYLNSRERYNGFLFPGISRFSFYISSRLNKKVAGGFSFNIGKTIYRDRTAPEMGNSRDFETWMTLKPTNRLSLEPHLIYAKMNHRDSYLAANTGADKEIYDGYIFRTRMTYQFTRELYLRMIFQYNDFGERLSVEPLLTYKLNPFTKFYVGMNSNYKNYYPLYQYDPGAGKDIVVNGIDKPEWALSSTQFFAKIQYLFRI